MTEDYSLDKIFESNKSFDKKEIRRVEDDVILEESKNDEMKTSIIITKDNEFIPYREENRSPDSVVN